MDSAALRDDASSEGSAGPTPTIYCQGVPPEQRARIDATGAFEPVDSPQDAGVVLLSTRLSRGELAHALREARQASSAPVVALVHTGGEPAAVEVMRHGGAGVVAEGNEGAVIAFLHDAPYDDSLVETYDRRVGTSRSTDGAGQSRDPATGLPNASAFETRLEEFEQAEDLPRIAFARVLGLHAASRKLAAEVATVLRRRLGAQYRELTRAVGAELYALDATDFAILANGLSPNRAELLARQLARITESFAPSGNQTLSLALGHAGPEVATEVPTLRELAARALSVAAEQRSGAIVGADSLSLGVSSTTELEAALRMLDVVERHDAYLPGHGNRVADLAGELARHLGLDAAERSQIRLAAHLHDLGKIGLDPQVAAGPHGLDDDALQAWRTHPQRGSACLLPSGGPAVAAAVRSHHEHWDGTGFPDGLEGEDIPLAARLIAIADVYDGLVAPSTAAARSTPEAAVARLRELAGTVLDPAVVEAASVVLARMQAEPDA